MHTNKTISPLGCLHMYIYLYIDTKLHEKTITSLTHFNTIADKKLKAARLMHEGQGGFESTYTQQVSLGSRKLAFLAKWLIH